MSITFPAEGIPYEGLLFRLPEPEDLPLVVVDTATGEIQGNRVNQALYSLLPGE